MITVAICTYNRADLLEETLGRVLQQQVPASLEWEILVVDNASTDHTRRVVERLAAESEGRVRYIHEQRQGISWARNSAVDSARGEVIAFTDDDVIPEPDWLANVVGTFRAHDCAGVGGRVLERWEFEPPDWWSATQDALNSAIVGFHPGGDPRPLEIPPFGANMAFRREMFEEYGGFRTDLGRSGDELISGEDTEFGRRLLDAGEVIRYAPEAIVRHPVSRERATKAYFRRWYYDFGRTVVRRDLEPSKAPKIMEVPRHFFRDLFEELLKMVTRRSPHRRFLHELRARHVAGMIVESWRTTRGRR